jgi:hypothetical protein
MRHGRTRDCCAARRPSLVIRWPCAGQAVDKCEQCTAEKRAGGVAREIRQCRCPST